MVINRNRLIEDIKTLLYNLWYRDFNLEVKPISLVFIFESLLLKHYINFNIDIFSKELKSVFNSKIDDELILNNIIDMITDKIKENIEKYTELYFYNNRNYRLSLYKCSYFYKEVKNSDLWLECPKCRLKPLVHIADNFAYTGCGCGKDNYNNFSIRAESISSRYNRKNNVAGDTEDELMTNWNYWCKTGENLFEIKREEFKKDNIEIW